MGFEYENPLFHCFVAEVDNKIVGAAIIYNRFSTWKGKTLHLEDLVVTKKMRGQGIGSKLLDKVILHGKYSMENFQNFPVKCMESSSAMTQWLHPI